ncbi:MAG: prepilin-type N-terminal cleavage/methylation domain-containing protein [Magnetococcales bacterium]|nr:prepilin-type N-terminal cleavage/methylation domain-containing protein [Magnetococcales bacterium]
MGARHSHCRGFTLIEVLLATILSVILMGMCYGFFLRLNEFQMRMAIQLRLHVAAIEAYLLLADGAAADVDGSGTIDPSFPGDRLGGLRGGAGWSGTAMRGWFYRNASNEPGDVQIKPVFNTLTLSVPTVGAISFGSMQSARYVLCTGVGAPHADCLADNRKILLGYLFNHQESSNALFSTQYRASVRNLSVRLAMADPGLMIQGETLNYPDQESYKTLPTHGRLTFHTHFTMVGDYP